MPDTAQLLPLPAAPPRTHVTACCWLLPTAAEADELLDDDRYFTDLYSVLWTLSRQERFLVGAAVPLCVV
jgi:hypothetical protein